jgi:3-keto-5-aminohexanoate cleavage enzyme
MEKRIAPIVELKPEMASLNVGSMNFGDEIFMNHPVDVRKLAGHMRDLGVVPEVEVYEVGHISIAKKLHKDGLLGKPIHYQFVMGVPGGIQGEANDLFYMRNSISSEDSWAVAGVGRFELPLAVMAIVSGGHVRVGFEDNIFYSKGVLAKSNAELVARIRRIAEEVGRKVASPDEAREMLGVK